MRNITSTQDLEHFFSNILKGSSRVTAYDRQGKNFINFRGRLGMSNSGQKCIIFQDGTQFPLLDSSGENVFGDLSTPTSRRFINFEGELVPGPDNKAYIQLKNGLRFALEGYSTYSSTKTYTYSGPQETHSSSFESHNTNPYENVESDYGHSSGSSWRTESSTSGSDIEGEYEMHSSRSHEERRRIQSRVYSRNSEVPIGDNLADPRYDSKHQNSRYKRESDVISVKDFEKLEMRQRRQITSESKENPCKHAKCFEMKCDLGPLKKGEEAHLRLKYRIKVATLKKVAYKQPVEISTKVITRVTRFAALKEVAEQNIQSQEVFTNVEPTTIQPETEVVPLWVVVLSACAGVIILLLLIYLLYKV